MMKTENLIVTMTFDFSLQIIELYKQLAEKKEFIISKQLLRSATSIGANVEEATAGQSKKDFVSKMAIASKEARGTLLVASVGTQQVGKFRLRKISNFYREYH